jgi:hypothetical protein
MAKKAAKRAVSEARGRVYENLYQWLDTKGGESDIYNMAKIRERKRRDVNQVKCIKDGLVKDKEIKHRWWEYSISCSMGRMRARPLNWTTPLMIPGVVCGKSRSLRSRRL